MAIYHFTVKVISRGGGRSAVAAAAYRSGSEIEDQRLGCSHDFSNKPGVVHSEVMLPKGAPERWRDRSVLWNEVEAGEKRKDAQLAREVEFALPREMAEGDAVDLARSFVQREFVDRGMVADLNIHWDIGADGQAKPHAHVMLSLREISGDGFGKKVREWNAVAELKGWRERWADHVNTRCQELGIEARIDHRTLEAQGIELEPQNKIGPAGMRREDRGEEAERAGEHREIARRNGERILDAPELAFSALTRQHATFTKHDMARLVHRHSDGLEQFNAVMGTLEASPELVALGKDAREQERFTTREMIAVETRMERAADQLASDRSHGVRERIQTQVLSGGAQDCTGDEGIVLDRDAARDGIGAGVGDDQSLTASRHAAGDTIRLSEEQETAFRRVTGAERLSIVIGYAGTGKSTMLGAAREAWEREGYTVKGGTLSGIAAEGLQAGSGIESRTLASLEHAWAQDRDQLSSRDVIVIDEAGMVGSRQMERVLSHAVDAGAKVVIVVDAEQLQAIEAGAAFRILTERHGAAEIREVRRQHHDWQRLATRELATGRTAAALGRYGDADRVHARDTQAETRELLVERWNETRKTQPEASQIMLAYTREDVKELNQLARATLHASGDLPGTDTSLFTERGMRLFTEGDRMMFLRNERGMGVKNGTLGTVLAIEGEQHGATLTVALDGPGKGENASILTFEMKNYAHIEHGYAATIHKAQGVTVDHAHVLASSHMDRHAAYVALTRHRSSVDLYWSRETMKSHEGLVQTLSRERPKDSTLDYDAKDRQEAALVKKHPVFGAIHDAMAEVRFMERREIAIPQTTKDRIVNVREDLDRAALKFAAEQQREARITAIQSDRAFSAFRGMTQQADSANELVASVVNYTQAYHQATWMKDMGIPATAEHKASWDQSIMGMDRIDPQLTRDLKSALNRDPSLFGKVHEKDQQIDILKAMVKESKERAGTPESYKPAERQQADPATRAQNYVQAFHSLERDHERLDRYQSRDERKVVEGQLQALAGTIKADREAEGIMKAHGREMGVERSSNLERVLQAQDAREAQRQSTREVQRSRGHAR
jgi:Ti-type conjugative transfer relaxase TraA